MPNSILGCLLAFPSLPRCEEEEEEEGKMNKNSSALSSDFPTELVFGFICEFCCPRRRRRRRGRGKRERVFPSTFLAFSVLQIRSDINLSTFAAAVAEAATEEEEEEEEESLLRRPPQNDSRTAA